MLELDPENELVREYSSTIIESLPFYERALARQRCRTARSGRRYFYPAPLVLPRLPAHTPVDPFEDPGDSDDGDHAGSGEEPEHRDDHSAVHELAVGEWTGEAGDAVAREVAVAAQTGEAARAGDAEARGRIATSGDNDDESSSSAVSSLSSAVEETADSVVFVSDDSGIGSTPTTRQEEPSCVERPPTPTPIAPVESQGGWVARKVAASPCDQPAGSQKPPSASHEA